MTDGRRRLNNAERSAILALDNAVRSGWCVASMSETEASLVKTRPIETFGQFILALITLGISLIRGKRQVISVDEWGVVHAHSATER